MIRPWLRSIGDEFPLTFNTAGFKFCIKDACKNYGWLFLIALPNIGIVVFLVILGLSIGRRNMRINVL